MPATGARQERNQARMMYLRNKHYSNSRHGFIHLLGTGEVSPQELVVLVGGDEVNEHLRPTSMSAKDVARILQRAV
jgi:hypothetical protein